MAKGIKKWATERVKHRTSRAETSVLLGQNIGTLPRRSPYFLLFRPKNGEKAGKFKVHKDDKLIDLKEFLFAGKSEMTVAMLVSGEPVKKWSVEPIIVKDTGIEAEAVPEIEELKAELARTKKALAELTASIQNDTL